MGYPMGPHGVSHGVPKIKNVGGISPMGSPDWYMGEIKPMGEPHICIWGSIKPMGEPQIFIWGNIKPMGEPQVLDWGDFSQWGISMGVVDWENRNQ